MTRGDRGPGRPRHSPATSGVAPRDQVLNAAAELFVTRGFAATSTREIAERVGIRQASLYYHFAGKDEILAELLQRSVRPTVDKIAKIEALVPPETHETVLYLLALVDIRTLAEAPHNVGVLYGLPEVTSNPVTGSDKPHVSSSENVASAHGWWRRGDCSGDKADVRACLLEWWRGKDGTSKWVTKKCKRKPSVTARVACTSLQETGWANLVDVDVNGSWDNGETGYKTDNIYCRRDP